MTKVRVGPVGVAAVGNRRERRAVVRHWWELDGRRGGWWLLAGLVPFGFGRPAGRLRRSSSTDLSQWRPFCYVKLESRSGSI